MSRKIILIKQELLLLVYELNRSGLLAENEKIRDRKSGSAGMPRPISYAVFCLKKKEDVPVAPASHSLPVSPGSLYPHAPPAVWGADLTRPLLDFTLGPALPPYFGNGGGEIGATI